jgi:hypothetical protein
MFEIPSVNSSICGEEVVNVAACRIHKETSPTARKDNNVFFIFVGIKGKNEPISIDSQHTTNYFLICDTILKSKTNL